MTIEHSFHFTCDHCGEKVNPITGDLAEAKRIAEKRRGWVFLESPCGTSHEYCCITCRDSAASERKEPAPCD